MSQKQFSFLMDLKNFSELDEFKDFTIKVGSSDFKVHRFLLAARCESFAEKIKSNPSMKELKIDDISAEIFEHILKYVYTDEEPRNSIIARKILGASKSFKIEGLKEICEEIVLNEMEDEKNLNILAENLNLGFKSDCEKLKFEAFGAIQKQFEGHRLKDELLNHPEIVKKVIEAKKLLDENSEATYENLNRYF